MSTKQKKKKNWLMRFAAGLFYISGRPSLAKEVLRKPPRRDYYLFGNYKLKKAVPKRFKGRARENAEFKLRMQAYENACKTFKESGECPEEDPLTLQTFFFELFNRVRYANNHIGSREFFTTYVAIFIYIALIILTVNLIFKIISKLI